MIPLSDATRASIERLRPKQSDYAPRKSVVPPFGELKQRRFILCHGKARVALVLVDDDDSCRREQENYRPVHSVDDAGFADQRDWHTYRTISEYRKENMVAIRCPASLSAEERLRLEFDDPPGRAATRLAIAISATRNHGHSRPEPEDNEPFA